MTIPGLPDWARPDPAPAVRAGPAVLPVAVSVDPPAGVPVIQAQTDGRLVVLPLPPGVGGDNAAVINAAALMALGAVEGGGTVVLGPYLYTTQSVISLPWNVSLEGHPWATQITPQFTGDTIRWFNPVIGGGIANKTTQQDQSGRISGLHINGAGAGAGSAGLHMGDMLGAEISDVFIRNFTGAGSIGFHFDNTVWWTEKLRARHLQTANCTTGVQWDVSGGTASFEYCQWDIHNYWYDGQNALVMNGGAFFTGDFFLHGNVQANTSPPGPWLTMAGGVLIRDGIWSVRCENNGTFAPQTINVGAGTNHMVNVSGLMAFFPAAPQTWVASNAGGGNGQISGSMRISGDPALNAVQLLGPSPVPPPRITSYGPSAPASTVSTVPVMAGLGFVYTPVITGKLAVQLTGAGRTLTAVATVGVQAAYGTNQTIVAAGSNNVNVNTFTGTQSLSVQSTAALTGTGTVWVATSSDLGMLAAQISYTGTSGGNTLTGCTLVSGSGILSTGGGVTQPPVNGAAATGTAFGPSSVTFQAAGTTFNVPFPALTGSISGLAVGTPVWVDLQFDTSNAADAAQLGAITAVIQEVS